MSPDVLILLIRKSGLTGGGILENRTSICIHIGILLFSPDTGESGSKNLILVGRPLSRLPNVNQTLELYNNSVLRRSRISRL